MIDHTVDVLSAHTVQHAQLSQSRYRALLGQHGSASHVLQRSPLQSTTPNEKAEADCRRRDNVTSDRVAVHHHISHHDHLNSQRCSDATTHSATPPSCLASSKPPQRNQPNTVDRSSSPVLAPHGAHHLRTMRALHAILAVDDTDLVYRDEHGDRVPAAAAIVRQEAIPQG